MLKVFCHVKQCIDYIGGKLFNILGKFFESSYSNNSPFFRELSYMK